jgi:hypothetical protein
MGNDASRVAVVDVCRGSLVRAQVGARGGTEAILLHEHGLTSITAYWINAIHIPFTQFNVTSVGLGYYMTLKLSLYPS